ncbi:zinc-binding dehydrogenase [Rhizobium acaciae]|uniref:zinc-binding dehydrogenase n=1 Tax=Rhizobium acaciae TaxID=2989736 RepID=UPI003872F6F2
MSRDSSLSQRSASREFGRLLDDGKIRVVIDSIYPLAEKVHERTAQGYIQGKIVLGVAKAEA